MYKVILIDDEAIIVEGLKSVVDWDSYGCKVVGTAFSASEGTKAIRTYAPDILFSDIKMPDTDALTMLAGLRSEFPNMQVTVLTGYRNFEYAQEAIRIGVTRLLLKPSRMEEINEALATMIANLEKANSDSQPKEVMHDDEMRANNFIVRQALSYLEKSFAEKITLQDISDHCFVSQWHLSKLLNKHTGKSFYDLLNATRIRAAKRLLADPSLKIGDICELVGYADTGHFSRVFKRLEGISANEYRNQLEV